MFIDDTMSCFDDTTFRQRLATVDLSAIDLFSFRTELTMEKLVNNYEDGILVDPAAMVVYLKMRALG